MKKKKLLSSVILALMIGIFLTPSGVEAASLGTCNYTVSDPSRLGLAKVKKMTFSVTVNDDGSITKKNMYVNDKNVGLTTGALKGDSFYLEGTIIKELKKNGTFYKAFKKYNDCPDMQIIYYVSNQQLGIYTEGNRDSDGNQSITVSTTKKGGSSTGGNSNSGGNKVYCTRKPQNVLNSGQKVTVSFEEKGGVKKVRLVSTTRNDKVFDYDKLATLDNVTFRVDQASVSKFWSKKCENTEMYFAAINGDKSNIIIQTTKPNAIDNASYTTIEEKYDNGGVKTYENNATLDGLNQKFDKCSQLFDMTTEGSFGWLLQKLLNYIKIAGPILVVLLSAVDFIKAIASSEEDAFKKAQSKLVIRLVAALALFLVPTFVELLLGLINGISDPTCGLK